MEKAELENFCWYRSGQELGRRQCRIPVTKCWDGDACRRMESTREVLKKVENSLF